MKWMLIGALGLTLACAGSDADFKDGSSDNDNSFNNPNNPNQGPNEPNNPPPEEEDEFEFSSPAVAGDRIFVANETLNAVAVIDSESLRISSVPVGFKPTVVAGAESNIFVLNEGSSTVTRIDPETLKTQTFSVMRRANDLVVSPDGSTAFSWFNATKPAANLSGQADLSAVSIITADASYQLAVGFDVREVRFSENGEFALIISADGISRIRVTDITGDAIVPPVSLGSGEVREVLVDATGRWALGRRVGLNGMFMVDLETGELTDLEFGLTPSDLDWVDANRLLATFRNDSLGGLNSTAALIAIPEGIQALAELEPVIPPDPDMGSDMDDMGDMTDMDMGTDPDADMADMPADMGMMVQAVEGVEVLDLEIDGLGAAEVAPAGNHALIFSTIGSERRAILLDLDTLEQRPLAFEKGVRGAVADSFGRTFVVIHDRVNEPILPSMTPLDPEYIERSWAVSLVNVEGAANRLVLTSHYPDLATLWSDEDGLVKLYMTFGPQDGEPVLETHQDLLVANLETFATSTTRLAGVPEGLGVVSSERQVFISQRHPQGRMTFIDVDDESRQTVTGYQLNAGID